MSELNRREQRAVRRMAVYVMRNGGENVDLRRHDKELRKLARKAGVTDDHQVSNLICIAAYGEEKPSKRLILILISILCSAIAFGLLYLRHAGKL